MNVKVFPLQCLYNQNRPEVNQFWEGISGLAETPLLMLESFGDSANMLEAVAYAAAGEGLYDHYEAKFDSEVVSGARVCASSNMMENRTKLRGFSKGKTE